jgi:hypothetical protein
LQLVDAQGEVLDQIEENVESARDYVARAHSELVVANDRKAKGRKTKAMIGGGLALVTLPVIGTKVAATALAAGAGAAAYSRRSTAEDRTQAQAGPALFAWMWADAGQRGGKPFTATARANPLRWSAAAPRAETTAQLSAFASQAQASSGGGGGGGERRVRLRVLHSGGDRAAAATAAADGELEFESAAAAVQWLQSLAVDDSEQGLEQQAIGDAQQPPAAATAAAAAAAAAGGAGEGGIEEEHCAVM